MLVVHGGWQGRRLVLWAEDTTSPGAPATGTATRGGAGTDTGAGAARPRRRGAKDHPFAAANGRLAAALGDAAGGAERAEVEVLLPGSPAGPLPSPESGLATRLRVPKISSWRVPALLLGPAAALDLLGRLAGPAPGGTSPASGPGTPRTGPGAGPDGEPDADPDADPDTGPGSVPVAGRGTEQVTGPVAGLDAGPGEPSGGDLEPGRAEVPEWGAGGSLRYLAVVAEHARALVRRGRVLPQLAEEDGGHAARWRPVVTGADAAAFGDLARAMPPVCRAAGGEHPAARVLADALGALADQAVRRALPDRLLRGNRPGTRTPLAERWLFALTGDDAALPGADPAEAGQLGTTLGEWFAAASRAEGPVRVCFRLIEPAGEEDAWELEFALQPVDEPSLYVPAAVVWREGRIPGLPGRPDETLLAGLGRAVRLCPELHAALADPAPSGMVVDTAWAFGFLRRAAPLLQAAGFGVRLPDWAGRRNLGLKLTTRSRTAPGRAAAGQGFGLAELVDFRIDLAIGDHTIGEEELAELARLKVPLVRVRGQWVELDDRQLKAALAVLERRRSGEMSAGEVLQEVVAGGDEDLPLVAVDADGPLGDLLSGEADRRLTTVATPPGFQGTLRPYQERGLSWLAFLSGIGLGGVLADDMGLGKTAQTLALLLAERTAGRPAPTLLVCPMSLVGNWQKEAARFAPSLRVYVHHGAGRRRGEELAAEVAAADLVVTTYGTALRDAPVLAGFGWGRVVCDEAQAIKNSAARQAQAVRGIPARTRLALTGTPVENHLAELWSIMEFANPGLLGPARRFRERYQEPIEARGDEDAARALRRATGPFVLRRLKTDQTIISDLPEKLDMKVWCTLTPEQASLYQAVVGDMMDRIDGSDGIERRGNVLAAMTRLKQVCNHPAQLLKDGSRLAGRSGKLARLEELAQEIVEEGDKALVFTQYAEWGAMLQPYLAAHLDRPVLWLHGGLPKKRRDELVERFQGDDQPMIFLLSLKAAGTGLNLTAANHVVHVDRWWNPAVEDQATDRAFRIGQTRNVQVRKFICAGTLEERIDEMIERKKALAQRVVGAGEDWITGLSTEQLRELFRLGPEAVS
ncbi:helicase HelZ [Sphaerisporangium rufum]|uniref:Helicase HelZ n=1 Tax=Sphaerisporangium rufum TaxID=1381558 RepID=A0A919QXT3_9ACTN|nr:DEAD/DEAH box helicase [Sphaerisporangium rufum]GII76086.1 helicase HelZ [Sphaerisporangium rufum]